MASTAQIKQAIQEFLGDMLEKKVAERQKDIDGLRASNTPDDSPKMIAALNNLESVKQHYEYDHWIEHAATKMVNQATLSTHISKGVHSMSRGDSVLFVNEDTLPAYLVGTHTTPSKVLDISGSAGALPLYNFINTPVDKDETIRDLIEKRSGALARALSSDKAIGLSYVRLFRAFLNQKIKNPATSNLNKQTLFPVNADNLNLAADYKKNDDIIDCYEYVNTVPLYASVFCYEVRKKVNDIRFSEHTKQASTNRFALNASELEHTPYQTIRNLAVLKLGGSKPANISKVVVMSNGETLLLPSLPPKVAHPDDFILPTDAADFFNTAAFNRQTAAALKELASAYIHYGYQPNYENKRRQRNALYFLLTNIFDLVVGLRKRQAGWLDGYALVDYQQYWLDPQVRVDQRVQTNWQDMVLDAIAHYINNKLHGMLIKNANEFNHEAFSEWRKAAVTIANKYKLNNSEVLS